MIVADAEIDDCLDFQFVDDSLPHCPLNLLLNHVFLCPSSVGLICCIGVDGCNGCSFCSRCQEWFHCFIVDFR